MKPCELPCPKCGSPAVKRLFVEEKMRWSTEIKRNFIPNYKYLEPSPYMSYGLYSYTATRNCMLNDCIICSYSWDSLPLEINPLEDP